MPSSLVPLWSPGSVVDVLGLLEVIQIQWLTAACTLNGRGFLLLRRKGSF